MADPLTPIHWREGLFMRPHHLQEQSGYASRLLAYHLDAFAPFHYGVRAIEVDEGRLEEGLFVLRRLELLLPSGEVIQVPENARLRSRNIIEPGPGQESRMRVWLGVRRLRDQEPNLSLEGLDELDPARYIVEHKLVYDRNTGRDSQEVEFEYLNARIFFDGESMEEFDAFPIAEIVPPEVGLPLSRLSRTFVPPSVRVGASQVLEKDLRQLHAAAASKAAKLAARADAEGVRTGQAAQGDVLALWKLHTLHGYLPYLREAVEVGSVHPYPLFVELCRLTGQLSSFSTAQANVELPMYDHMDPGAAFGILIPKLHGLLDELIPSNYARVPLVQEGFRMSGDLREEWLEMNNRFFICARSDLPEALVQRWFTGTTKMSATPKIDSIVERRLRGVPTRPCDRPRVLPPREGFSYFELQRDTPDWADVRSDRTISVHLAAEAGMTPEALASVIVEMYVVFGG